MPGLWTRRHVVVGAHPHDLVVLMDGFGFSPSGAGGGRPPHSHSCADNSCDGEEAGEASSCYCCACDGSHSYAMDAASPLLMTPLHHRTSHQMVVDGDGGCVVEGAECGGDVTLASPFADGPRHCGGSLSGGYPCGVDCGCDCLYAGSSV